MKLQLILHLYDLLVAGEKVSRADFCQEHAIAERTFYRYLKEIGEFLRNYKNNYIVDVVDFSGLYFLKKCTPGKTD